MYAHHAVHVELVVALAREDLGVERRPVRLRALGVRVRAGVHEGEPEVDDRRNHAVRGVVHGYRRCRGG